MSSYDLLAIIAGKTIAAGLSLAAFVALMILLANYWRPVVRVILAVLYTPFYLLRKLLEKLARSAIAH